MKSKIFGAAILSVLCACNLQKRDQTASPTDKAIFTYFASRQYVTDSSDVAALSEVLATPVVGLKTDSFKTNGIPALDGPCASETDGIRVPLASLTHFENIGAFSLVGLSPNESLPLKPQSDQSLVYTINQQLSAGDYTLKVGDASSPANFTQGFTVLKPSDGMVLQSGADGTAAYLPSPQVPAPTDANYTITVDRSKDLYIGFNPPDGTTYVRISLHSYALVADGQFQDGMDVTCYVSPANTIIGIAQSTVAMFDAGDNGRVTFDFVKTDFAGAQGAHVLETMVDSSVRQVHGLVVTGDASGAQKPIHLGVLKFQ